MQSCVVVVYGFCAFVVFCFLRFELHACALEVGFAVRFHNGRCPKVRLVLDFPRLGFEV